MIPPGYVSIRSAYTKVSQLNDLDAVGRLTFYLSTGQLQAFDFGNRGEKQLIRAEFWQNIPEGIRRDVFQKGTGSMTHHQMPFREIVVLEDDLVKVLPPEDNAISVESMEPSSIGKAGRHPKYDWDQIWAGIVRIVHDNGLPKSQEEMIYKVQLWYDKFVATDGAPSRSALQPRIKKLFAIMREN
jgi:hypothetical protein